MAGTGALAPLSPLREASHSPAVKLGSKAPAAPMWFHSSIALLRPRLPSPSSGPRRTRRPSAASVSLPHIEFSNVRTRLRGPLSSAWFGRAAGARTCPPDKGPPLLRLRARTSAPSRGTDGPDALREVVAPWAAQHRAG